MTRYRGFGLLGALMGVVVLVCGAIFAGFGAWAGTDTSAGTGTGAGTDTGSGRADGGGAQARTPVGTAAPASADNWTGTWAAAPGGAEPGAPNGFPGRTIRNVVHTSIGGTSVRVTLSNLYSPTPLLIGHASVAVGRGGGGSGGSGAEAAPGSMRRVLFGQRGSVTVPPGGRIVSDPVPLAVPYAGDLLVTLYTPAPGEPVTYHRHAVQTSYLALGDRTEDLGGAAYTEPAKVWRYLTAVDVRNVRAPGAVVAFGDSITDGVGSRDGANGRWPDVLAGRLRERHIGVLNAGIGGNRVLLGSPEMGRGASGVSRFPRDVLDQTDVRAVVVDLGINDILRGETDPARITAGLRNLTRQAHARGLRVVGSTLTPFGGYPTYTPVTESVRERVNAEIRAGRVFDDVVDFDRAIRDPYAPHRLRPAYDSGDHLHPNDAGYRAMGRHLGPRSLSLEEKAPARL
ncbi:SGNH/GDSL hydrolase family protein [Streptomyces corynorhini]|uniref:SGNH/GDSL hydrolase family protein n=1 Tax=Streptomyces corynorhini TaxID=2282652 RepID=A0A370BAS4_9ACTN|nr:SGNH/GDSL hydrolase family protein [Streptomyces corynorhini]RDG36535.1 SGNH/GDSL hydrolase family protein [Streptomyces corynorhini]